MLSGSCNFVSANRLLQDVVAVYRHYLQQVSLTYTITVHVPGDKSGLGTDTAPHTEPASP